jgi:hypothetical protein
LVQKFYEIKITSKKLKLAGNESLVKYKIVNQTKNLVGCLTYPMKGNGGDEMVLSLTCGLGCSVFICCPIEGMDGVDDTIFVADVADDLS